MIHFGIDGFVGDRVTVETYGTDPYVDDTFLSVRVNGEEAEVQRVDRLRDGGSTTIHTDKGVLFYPAKMSYSDTRPTFNGEPIYEF
jgi:hypothetical protein